ncbi:hypothetical protein CR969_02650 [Candidatus Saccharibacteria bacterium]|nr:MAG: hypothetical protein CR969_02650 [Candidatus Saccharibacteria bacterium]
MTLEKPSDDQPQIDAEFAEIIEPINDNTAHQKARDLEDIMKQHLNEVIFNLIGGMSREEVIARLVSVLPTYLLTEYGLVPGEEVNVSCKMRSATQIATAEERESYAYEDGSLRQEYVDAWVEFMRNVYPDKEIDEDEKGLFVALNGETMIFGGIYLTDAGEGEDGVMDVKANILLSPKGTELILHVVPEDIDQFDNGLATVDDIEHHLSYHFPELYDQISDIADPDLSLEEQIDILKGLEIDYDGEAYPELGPLIGKYLTFHTNFDAHENNIEISGPYYGLSEDGSLVESNSEHYTMGAEPERLIFTSDDDGYGNIFLAVSKFSEESNNPAKHLYFIPVYSIDSMYSLRDQVKNSVSENSKMLDIYEMRV